MCASKLVAGAGRRFESARRLSYCADLQGKRRSTPKLRHGIRATVLQPILQRSFYGSGCPVLKGWVIDFWVTFSGVILIVRRYIRERPTSLARIIHERSGGPRFARRKTDESA